MRRLVLILGALLAAWPGINGVAQDSAVPAVGVTAPTTATLSGRELLVALRHGGYVLYLRHTSTDFGQSDEAMTSFEDCSKQRNLTEQGRTEARAIGASLRSLQIPIGVILASPYCRTLETGRLVFGEPQVSPAVRGGPLQSGDADRYAALKQILATAVRSGTNTAIASHGNPYFAVMGPPYLAEGEMAVIKPQGDGRFVLVARVRKDEWAALASK